MKAQIAAAALIFSAFGAAGGAHAVTLDGVLDSAYGAAKSSVAHQAGAPENNFGAPTPFTTGAGYNIYLTSDASNVYGFLQTNGSGASAGAFANLYFDIDPAANNGSDIGFEVGAGNNRAFVAGGNGAYAPSNINLFTSSDGNTLEFSIPNADFTQQIAGLAPYGNTGFASTGSTVTLRISQAFGYSAAGGATYGDNRLGSVVIGGAVSAAPEPGTWALMLGGLGLLGGALRLAKARRREDAFSHLTAV